MDFIILMQREEISYLRKLYDSITAPIYANLVNININVYDCNEAYRNLLEHDWDDITAE